MPSIELADEERPVRRVSSKPGKKAFLPPKPAAPKPIVPVYPRKQARH